MEDLPTELTVITLNSWGLKFISKLRRERLTEIGRRLAVTEPAPHIVALQECWTQEDYQTIRRETRFILPYGKFYHSGAFGGGLAILSRWPIEESTMFRYPLNGRPTAFWRGDWYVGKGVACAKIRYGPGPKHVIEVFNTHTHAPYEHGPNDSYLCHRIAQAWEMAKLLRGAAERGHLVLGVGDFNMIPLSPAHRLITSYAPVRDVWRVLHPDSSLGASYDDAEQVRRRPIPTADFNLRENGVTSDSVYCTWRWTSQEQRLLGPGREAVTVPDESPDPRGHRLDYVFAGCGDVAALGGGWVVRSVRVGMTERHPELGCSLSDHFSVEATLAFHPTTTALQGTTKPRRQALAPETNRNGVVPEVPPSSSPGVGSGAETGTGTGTAAPSSTPAAATLTPTPVPSTTRTATTSTPVPPPTASSASSDDLAVTNGAYLQSPTASEYRLSQSFSAQLASLALAASDPPFLLPGSTYDEILAVIHKYAARERRQRTWRSAHFFASVLVTVACLVGVWFSSPRNFVAFLLVLVSSLGLAAGVIDGLIALLFFGWEIRALKEFEWEILNAKAAAPGGPVAMGERDKVW